MAESVQQPRPYRKSVRAEREAETRRRITEATVALHRELGPARTTVSAIAERAGVQRLTVYRHFPDEGELLGACSAHWLTAHPIPDPTPWAAIADPEERLRTALGAIYGWYRGDEQMIANVGRDAPGIPVLAAIVASGLPVYLQAVRELLLPGWGARGRRRRLLAAALGHALDFETWRSLERRQGLEPDAAIELMVRAAGATASARA
jgi:AcrR family transcriptional regulator